MYVNGVKLNPEPMKKCPKYEKMMPTRSNNCKYGYLLCYVAVRVLHFSAFILYSVTYKYNYVYPLYYVLFIGLHMECTLYNVRF